MAKKTNKKSFSLTLRNYFITGVVVLIPIGFTLYLTKILIGISSRIFGVTLINFFSLRIDFISVSSFEGVQTASVEQLSVDLHRNHPKVQGEEKRSNQVLVALEDEK